MSKSRSRETNWRLCALIVERHNIGLDPGDCSTGGEKWLDSGYNLKVEPIGAADNWI